MYVVKHKTKQALKTAVTKSGGVAFTQSDPFGGKPIANGEIFVAGPASKPRWHTQCVVSKGKIVRVL